MSWSELPPELLHLVSQHLNDPFDFVYFRAVCMEWRTSVALSDHPRFLPWLLRRDDDRPRDGGDVLQFYSLSSNMTRAVSVPEVSTSVMVIGHWAGCLLAIADDSSMLINPLTKAHTAVPGENICRYDPSNRMWHDDNTDDTVATSPGNLTFWKRHGGGGYQQWGAPSAIPFNLGHLYYKAKEGEIGKLFNITGDEPLTIVPLPESHLEDAHHVVRTAKELLRVARYKSKETEEYSFAVYEVADPKSEKPDWIKMNSIGDRALFLSRFVSFCVHASNFTGFRGNSIYFIKDGASRTDVVDGGGCLHRYCLENARVERCFGVPWSTNGGTWVVPRLEY